MDQIKVGLFLDPSRFWYASTRFFFKTVLNTIFKTAPQSGVESLEFNGGFIVGSRKHKVYLGIRKRYNVQLFTETQ